MPSSQSKGAPRRADLSPNTVEGQAGGVGSTVYLFATTEGASGYLSDSVSEIESRSHQEGVKSFKKADLDVGQDAARFDIEVNVPRDDGSTVAFWATAAAFRRGRLIGVVQMHSINASELEKNRLGGKAGALASTMNERMASVLAAAATVAPAAAGQ